VSPAKQRGSVRIHRGKWSIRWRETRFTEEGPKREVVSRNLREVTPADRRRKVRKGGAIDPDNPKGGAIAIPDDIEKQRAEFMRKAESQPGLSALQTIAELVEDHYLPDKAKELKASTIAEYRNLWKTYLKKSIGHFVAIEFTKVDARNIFSAITERRKISRGTAAHIRFFVRGLYVWAARNGLHSGENPGDADLPRGLPGRVRKTEAYSMDELNIMLDVFPDPMAQAIHSLAFGSAMRKGELASVRWEDIETSESGTATIHVRRSAWRGTLSTPKTESSASDIIVDASFMTYVEQWREICGNPDHGFLFPGASDCEECGKSKTAHTEKTGHKYRSIERPINLDSFARWKLIPLMTRCAICKIPKRRHRENADHPYKRDESIPRFKGWHAFRRGHSTELVRSLMFARGEARRPDGLRAASVALRHTGTDITDRRYNLSTNQERRAQQALRDMAADQDRHEAAQVLGERLRKQEKTKPQ
jgi:integrase